MANKDKTLTPMMQQFFSLKEKHPDALLLFRCGDFYETYCDDAVDASRILGITLTRRNNGAGNKGKDAMAGFPYHALDTYLPKLIRSGRRVAICDQLEDPKLTKKLVKRGITELVTPGVAMGDNVLNYKENNFLSAVNFGKRACGVAFLDISTGEFLVGQGTYDYVEKLLTNFTPKEILLERGKHDLADRYLHLASEVRGSPPLTPPQGGGAGREDTPSNSPSRGRSGERGTPNTYEMDDWVFTEQTAKENLLSHFKVKSMKGFGVDDLHSGLVAAGAILQYLKNTMHTQIAHITALRRIEEERYVRLDKFTVRSLELLFPMQEGGRSLLDVLDRTVTPMGVRMLKRWVVFPLKDQKTITHRLDMAEYYFREPAFRDLVDRQFSLVGDLERIISKVAVGRATPRDLNQLKMALQALKPVKEACTVTDNPAMQSIGERMELCEAMSERIAHEISNDPPLLVSKGGVIRDGVDPELDELRQIAFSGKDYLLKIQEREAQQTGISSLKIGYNNVFGYYLEVRNTYKDHVPAEWVRKQTLAQAERYITQELKEYEEKILGAEDKILSIENRLFNQLLTDLQQIIPAVQRNATLIAEMDCLLSFAKSAEEHHYVRPIIDDSDVIDIRQGRHPVIEDQMGFGEHYVPNDIKLDTTQQQIMMITGPNMAGKSALLRQTALIVLMAQIGSFVPAESARIGMVDKIFTRVGASDNISLGESTFMVEMTEASNILNNVTPRSLVLFDELGRGTSTYDGISIAWAIVEYLHEHPKARARTLFATHYHELNDMEQSFSRIRNYHVSVREADNRVIFMRKLVRGGSEHSFGIHVAQMAGMPKSIVKRANEILRQLEGEDPTNKSRSGGSPPLTPPQGGGAGSEGTQLSFFQLDDPVLCQVRDEILGLDINNLTPVDALNKLNEIKKIVTGK